MNNKAKGVIIFFLLIIVGVLCYYIVINKDKNYVPTPTVANVIKKEYKEKDYVFDTAYSTIEISLPYINLDYTRVNSVNYQIKKLYEDNIARINEASYEYYINDIVLSVILKLKIDNKNVYYTYNINMQNGKEVTFEEIYYKYSQQDDALKKKISEYIENNDNLKSHLNSAVTKEFVVDNSYNNYKVNALSNNVKFYLDDKKDLNVVIKIELNEVYNEYAIFQM